MSSLELPKVDGLGIPQPFTQFMQSNRAVWAPDKGFHKHVNIRMSLTIIARIPIFLEYRSE